MEKRRTIYFIGIFLFVILTVFISFEPVRAESKVIKLRFANLFPPTSRHSKICEEFIADVQERTGGRIQIQYYAGGSLLKGPAIFKGVESGIADIGFAPIVYTPGRMPVSEAFMLPFSYPSGWVSCQVANDFFHRFKPKEWDKVHVLWMHASNPTVLITTKPVNKLEDLQGMVIRAPGRAADPIKALGATPAPIPMMEVYDSMSKNVIQGVSAPYETLKSFRFAEVAKYVTDSWQVGNSFYFYVVMNKRSYNRIPSDLRPIFDQLCGEFKERIALMWNILNIEGKEFALKNGVEIIQLPLSEMSRWKNKTDQAINNFTKEMVSKGYKESEVKGWSSYLKERIAYWTEKQKQYRIQSATGPEGVKL